MNPNGIGVILNRRTETREQSVEHGRMIEVVRHGSEPEGRRVEQPQLLEARPRIAGALQMRNVGQMGDFVETQREILAHGVCCRRDHEQRKNDRDHSQIAAVAGRASEPHRGCPRWVARQCGCKSLIGDKPAAGIVACSC